MNSTGSKIVYVLVSDPDDHFTEMAMLSIYCARRYSPSSTIELVIDKNTYNNFKDFRGTITDNVDKVNVIDVRGENNAFTSRMLKTQLRHFVEDDYLYVDIDALPVNDVGAVFDVSEDVAMAHAMNLPPNKFVFQHFERQIFDKTGWPLPNLYFNSGVMFVKDNLRTKNFFKSWHELWSESSKLGLHKDQPAMHEALRKESMRVKSLEAEWNVMLALKKGAGAKNPKIYHYSTIRFDSRKDTYFHEIVKRLKIEKKLDIKLLDLVISSKYPWTNRNSLKLNFASGNYHMLPKTLFNKLITNMRK